MDDRTCGRLLYLEHRRNASALLEAVLRAEGHDVVLYHTAPPDIAALSNSSYDVVLLNPHMPAADGRSLLDTLTAHKDWPPLLLITQRSDVAVAKRALQLGLDHYLFQGTIAEHAQLLPLAVQQALRQRDARRKRESTLNSLRQDNRNLTLLTRLSQLLSSTLNMDQVISQLVQTITEIVVTEGSSVWLWDSEQHGYLRCVAMYLDGKDITASALPMSPGEGIVGWVAEHGEAVNVRRVEGDARFSAAVDSQTGYQTRSILAVPLISGNKVIGVLEFVNKLAGYFNERDREMAETVAVYAANAIENARLLTSLSQQRDQLAKQNEALDAFAHSVAHDLKNPLTLVIGYGDMLRDDFVELSAENIQASLNTIVEYGIKMSSIVDALLLLARVGGDNVVETEAVDMDDVVDAVLHRMRPTLEEYGAKVTVLSTGPEVLGYASWLEEVWFNYLSNALKYGGRPPEMILSCDPPDAGFVRFWVQDNGPGITLADPMQLFSPDTQRRSRGQRPDSHGLGLSIVHRIVDRLGGAVGVESAPGKGSRFSFTLPVYDSLA